MDYWRFANFLNSPKTALAKLFSQFGNTEEAFGRNLKISLVAKKTEYLVNCVEKLLAINLAFVYKGNI